MQGRENSRARGQRAKSRSLTEWDFLALGQWISDLKTRLLDHADRLRRDIAPHIAPKRKAQMGQFMTPSSVAHFMASLFPPSTLQTCTLLDAGAGVGALSCAFIDRWTMGQGFNFDSIELQAYEIDNALREHLEDTVGNYSKSFPVQFQVSSNDFIVEAALQSLRGGRFTHVILNPPYKKISSDSEHRLVLRQAGIETVNLYSAFVALSLILMKPGGHLVAIIPRSFCNGPYYRPFREFLLQHAALRYIHLFDSRTKAFKDDDVLQENVIIMLERAGRQGHVTVSHSTDDRFTDITTQTHAFDRIVFPGDPEQFIYVPESDEYSELELSAAVRFSLQDLGIGISTGPVVDFRLKDHITNTPEAGTVPLLYPGHFSGQRTYWPKEDIKRGNAIRRNFITERWLYPNGFYTVVRRFSAKEERRRIVASVVRPDIFPNAEKLGFENHLNVFHDDKQGLEEHLAYGLAAFLNTKAVDDHFRRFSGHTQVNATDLRRMRYPSRAALLSLGRWAASQDELTQAMLNDRLTKLR